MIYGSSPYVQTNVQGTVGATGSTGATGIIGPNGPEGPIGNTGNTGIGIAGMTLEQNSNAVIKKVLNIFDDGSSIVGSPLVGDDGDYYIFVDGNNISTGAMNVFSGLTSFDLDGFTKSKIQIRGITTSSQNDNLKLIKIDTTSDPKSIKIKYDLTGLPYLGISGGSTGQLVVHQSGSTFVGLTGTFYDKNLQTVNLQTLNYGERVHFVEPVVKEFSNSNNDIAYYWQVDWEKANTFVLNSFADTVTVGDNVTSQIVYIKNPPSTDFSKAITIIVPSGVTGLSTTKFAVADDITDIDLNNLDYSVSWPLTYPPCFSNNVDVINMVYIQGIWYANYGIYNSNTDSVDWNSSYFCSEPVVEETGLCCLACSTGPSFVTTTSGCQTLVNQKLAQFFPGQGIDFPGCTANNAPVGVCCYKDPIGTIRKSPSLIRLCDCLRQSSDWTHWQIINDCCKNIDCIDCQDAYDDKGACCDGNGNCESSKTQTDCSKQNKKYWQGKGKVCNYPIGENTNFEICKTGIGGCCTSGNCTDTASESACSGSYYGCGFTCGSFTCEPDPVVQCPECISGQVFQVKKYDKNGNWTGEYHNLQIGDFFAGGIVAGVFNPNGVTCIGSKRNFSGIYPNNGACANLRGLPISAIDENLLKYDPKISAEVFDILNRGQILPSNTFNSSGITGEFYNTVYDPQGYGFTLPSPPNNVNCDSWLLIVLPFPARMVSKYYEILDGPNAGSPAKFEVLPVTDAIPFTNGTISGVVGINQFGESPQYPDNTVITDINQNRLIYTRRYPVFRFNHGGTGYAITFPDNLRTSVFQTGQGEDYNEDPSCQAIGSVVFHDGSYGTLPILRNGILGSTYWGNSTSFDGCSDGIVSCNASCSNAPSSRSRLGQPNVFSRTTGYYSRNNGLLNCSRMFGADIAEYFYRDINMGAGTDFFGIRKLYGTLNSSRFPQVTQSNGFTASFFFTTTFGQITQQAYPTMCEVASAYNRKYYSTEYMINEGYPQVSRWYVPSIDELGFIAHQCHDPAVNLQQKLKNYTENGTSKIGAFIGQSNVASNASWVWSSTASFNEGITFQYIQATGGTPQTNQERVQPGSFLYEKQITCRRFTTAWAMSFTDSANRANTTNLPQVANTFKSQKRQVTNPSLSADIPAGTLPQGDYEEVRLVRLIRCDQRFYKNDDPEFPRNRLWFIPRLTDSAIANGTGQPSGTEPQPFNNNSWSNTVPNYSVTNYDTQPQTDNVHKNRIVNGIPQPDEGHYPTP